MIPDFQSLMRPVLEVASEGEISIGKTVGLLADKFGLTEEQRQELLPSGKQSRFTNRVHWAKSYLKQAGLVTDTKRAHFIISERGKASLENAAALINVSYLEQFDQFKEFRSRTRGSTGAEQANDQEVETATPDEILREAHKRINAELSSELLGRVRESSPLFFENLVVELLLSMGYGGTSENAGQALGKSGDGGVDGVIDQDPLGVDQIYVQAKRYSEENTVGAGAIREFFGSLNIKKAQKGIFVTTSSFSNAANKTAQDLGTRIVLIDGLRLMSLMIRYNIGCREEESLSLKKIDEGFFE